MAAFTGTGGGDTITPALVSAGVVAVPAGVKPGNADDTIDAAAGADTIDSGGGNDTVKGGQGDDIVQLGAGTDTFIWNPGDGSDTVDGGEGIDTLDFFGGSVSENIQLSANGSHLRFFRNVANVTLDVDNVEKVIFHAIGGADHITVDDLSATDVTHITINLEGAIGTGAGDGQTDTVILNASDAGSIINISGVAGNISISGLPRSVALSAVEAMDTLVINALGGNDTISAAGLGTLLNGLALDAGNGNDTVTGSAGADAIVGGSGNDTVAAGRGDDVLFLGAGADRAIWRPGDGSDIVEGQGQTDTLEFNGSDASETFTLSANGGRSVLSRNVAVVTIDMNDMEMLVVNGVGGANHLTVGDISATDLVGPITYMGGVAVDTVDAHLAFNDMVVTGGGGADSLVGGRGDDVFRYVAGSDAVAGEVVDGGIGIGDRLQLINTGIIDFRASTLSGLERLQFVSGNSSATFSANQIGGSGIESVSGSAGNDGVTVRGDAIDLSSLLFSSWDDAADKIVLVGSSAVSWLTGSVRSDTLNGGGGADTMAGEAGDDTFLVDNAGDQVLEVVGQGSDTVFASVSYALAAGQHVERLATTLVAGTGSINLTGNELAQRVNGNNGANVLSGLAGNDTLFGYGGNDSIDGGAGSDTLYGISGADRFVFRQSALASGVDHIKDFGADDFIYVDVSSGPTGTLNANAFRLGANALDADDRFIYHAPSGGLYYDADGNGTAAKILFAVLDNKFALTAADIVLF